MAEPQPKVILVEPSHPGNVGAAARAMKTMSLSQLILVKPKQFPHPDAIARASRADDVLENAQIRDTLAEAVEGCHWVIGVTARSRKIASKIYTPHELIENMVEQFAGLQVAWVFGRERSGLSNEELDLCHAICTIPADLNYSSLNLAAAVQIICYEWFSRSENRTTGQLESEQLGNSMAAADEVEGFYQHLWASLAASDFMDPVNPKPLMRKVRRIFDRARLTKAEINILRGILKSFNKQ